MSNYDEKSHKPLSSMELYEAEGITIYAEPGLKVIKSPINIWIERGLSYERLRVDGLRAKAF